MTEPFHVAIVGLGGFAEDHHRALMALESEGVCRVVATCDPNRSLAAVQEPRLKLRERDVSVFESLPEMLSKTGSRLDLITLPVPIPVHAEMHRLAVEAGVPCYLEKPPSLWWPEFQSMLMVEERAIKQTQVGFNFVGDPPRRKLKQRIQSGEFGALREVRLHAVWPRDSGYYNRNDWAGKLKVGNQWVIDSCIGNALAHYVQNLLFWCGTGDAVGTISDVRAWLGRTRPIQSFDTALVEASMKDGVTLRIGATHAELGRTFEREEILLDKATIAFDRWNSATIHLSNGETELLAWGSDQGQLLQDNFRRYINFVTGATTQVTTSLAASSSFVALCNLALISSGEIVDIQEVPDLESFVSKGAWPKPEPLGVSLDDLAKVEQVAQSILSRLPL